MYELITFNVSACVVGKNKVLAYFIKLNNMVKVHWVPESNSESWIGV